MTTLLEPDRDQIEIFYDAVLRHAGTDGYLAVRSFYHNEKPYFHHSVPLSAGFHHLIDDLEDSARRAANEVERIVFCPPVAVFGNGGKARQEDLLVGPTLSVELDNNPDEARATLIGLLGPPTVEVKSGGQWIDPDGKAYDKMHLHWRLRIPARTAEQLKQLKQCRILAAKLVNGDPDPRADLPSDSLAWQLASQGKSAADVCHVHLRSRSRD